MLKTFGRIPRIIIFMSLSKSKEPSVDHHRMLRHGKEIGSMSRWQHPER